MTLFVVVVFVVVLSKLCAQHEAPTHYSEIESYVLPNEPARRPSDILLLNVLLSLFQGIFIAKGIKLWILYII